MHGRPLYPRSMCCFAGAAPLVVSGTKIFARTMGPYGVIVYSMQLSVDAEVAMILPVPVALGVERPEKSLSFVDFSHYEDFFDDLDHGFPATPAPPSVEWAEYAVAGVASPLPVEIVGSFDASFVPTMADFERLDPRFRLAPTVWEKLPEYADHGFAVFRLQPNATRAHPMAFRYRTRYLDRVFFPTVHVHDGEVHETADFDHSLYYQLSSERPARAGEEKSERPASDFVMEAHTRALVRMMAPVYRQEIVGPRPNRDIIVM